MILLRTGSDSLAFGSVQSAGAIAAVAGGLIMSTWGGFKRRIVGLLLGWGGVFVFGVFVFGLGRSVMVWIPAVVITGFMVVSDFAFVQDGSWVYMVALSTQPDEHDEMYQDVFLPVITAFRPLDHLFGRLTGGDLNTNQGLSTAQQLGFDADQVLVIVHADDVGCHASHTDGALAAISL